MQNEINKNEENVVSRCHLGSEINGFCLKKGQCLKATAATNKTSPTWGIMLRLI